MKITDGSFVAARDGRLLLGHADRPFTLREVNGGILVLLAELSRGTPAEDLAAALSGVVDTDRETIDALLASLREAGVVTDAATTALRDVSLEIAKVVETAPDLRSDPGFAAAAAACEGLTLTSPAAQYALWGAVRYLVANRIPGALVECGVWRGGSAALAASALAELGVTDRDVYLYDTFGWSWEAAGQYDGFVASPKSDVTDRADSATMEVGTAIEDVRAVVIAAGLAPHRLYCIEGLVQDTIPSQCPDEIALLRLDTDHYESTLHELRHLYPRLAKGGVVIVDDYGKLSGATRATDDYLAECGLAPLLHRIDTQGRVFLK